MQLLYIPILLLGVIQWVRAKPLNATTGSNVTLSAEEAFVQFYDEKLISLAPEIVEKIDNLTKQILKDETIKEAATPPVQEFKRIIEDYRIIQGFYIRTGFRQELPWRFSDKIRKYYPPKNNDNKEAPYISQLLRTLGYDELRNKYKSVLKKFISEEFLTKYEELKSQFSNNTEYTKKLNEWVSELKECQEYECCLSNFARSSRTFLKEIFAMVFVEMLEVCILFSHNATTFAQNVVKDPKLLQLSPPVGQQLAQNLKDFIKINDNVDHPAAAYIMPMMFHHIIYKFDNYASISAKDRQLLTNIFDDHGYSQLQLDRERKNKTDRQQPHDYLQEYQDYIAKQNQQDQLSKFLDFIDNLKRANTSQERMSTLEAFDKRNKNFADA